MYMIIYDFNKNRNDVNIKSAFEISQENDK